eukprot:356995-Chlamydomonas_euryale.AAC.8
MGVPAPAAAPAAGAAAPPPPSICTCSISSAWLRDDDALAAVAAVARRRTPSARHAAMSAAPPTRTSSIPTSCTSWVGSGSRSTTSRVPGAPGRLACSRWPHARLCRRCPLADAPASRSRMWSCSIEVRGCGVGRIR